MNILLIIPELGQGGAERAISKLSSLLIKSHNFFKVNPPDKLYSSEFQVEKLKNRLLELL